MFFGDLSGIGESVSECSVCVCVTGNVGNVGMGEMSRCIELGGVYMNGGACGSRSRSRSSSSSSVLCVCVCVCVCVRVCGYEYW